MGALSLQVLAGQTASYQSKLLGLMVENSLSHRAPLKPLPAGPASCSLLKKCMTMHQPGIEPILPLDH